MTQDNYLGSSFDEFLEEEGLLEDAESVAVLRILEFQKVELSCSD